MTTDKQRALAAIDSLNQARDLLESSTDQAQHDIAEDIGILLTKLESLQFFGRRPWRVLHRGITTNHDVPEDADDRYFVTEEFKTGYVVVARFRTLEAAKRHLARIESQS